MNKHLTGFILGILIAGAAAYTYLNYGLAQPSAGSDAEFEDIYNYGYIAGDQPISKHQDADAICYILNVASPSISCIPRR